MMIKSRKLKMERMGESVKRRMAKVKSLADSIAAPVWLQEDAKTIAITGRSYQLKDHAAIA
jgi:hypothetical protein